MKPLEFIENFKLSQNIANQKSEKKRMKLINIHSVYAVKYV